MRRINKLWPLDMLFEQSRRYLPSQQLFHLGSTFDKSHPSHLRVQGFSHKKWDLKLMQLIIKSSPNTIIRAVVKKKLFFMVRLTVSVDNPPITPPYSQGVVIFSK